MGEPETRIYPRDERDRARRTADLDAAKKAYFFDDTMLPGLPMQGDPLPGADANPPNPLRHPVLFARALPALEREMKGVLRALGNVHTLLQKRPEGPHPSQRALEEAADVSAKHGGLGARLLRYLETHILSAHDLWGPAGGAEAYDAQYASIPRPPLAAVFERDDVFGYLRTAGVAPDKLRRVDAARARAAMRTEEARLNAVMGEDSVDAAAAEGRLFLVEHTAFEGRAAGNVPAQKYVFAPAGLFVAGSRSAEAGGGAPHLRPVAVRCGGNHASEDVVVTPGDAAWPAAKLILSSADSAWNFGVTHGVTVHQVMESVTVALHRQLHPTHPVFRLLAPHTVGTLGVNQISVPLLWSESGISRSTLPFTYEDRMAVMREGYETLEFADLVPKRDFARRGVDDGEVLRVYPYRDDSLLVWDAIEAWARAWVMHWYDDDAAVGHDLELQAWVRELGSPGGGRLHGFGTDGAIPDRAALVELLAAVIFTAGPRHAVMHFQLDAFQTYARAFPTALFHPGPTRRDDPVQPVDMLPPLQDALITVALGAMLPDAIWPLLGSGAPVGTEEHPALASAFSAFGTALQRADDEIAARNRNSANRPVPYEMLRPSRIAASVSI